MSVAHIIVIAVVALIVLGPEKLPQVARMAGKALAEFRRITGDFRSTIEGEMREIERQTAMKEIRQKFPEHVHYDLQETQEATIASADTAALPAAPAPVAAADAEASTASGKPTSTNGEPTPA